MKVALCLSGHIRNFEQNYDTIKKNILDKFDTDIFIHTWSTFGWRAEGNEISLEENSFKGFDHYSGEIDIEKINFLYKPKKMIVEKYEDYEKFFYEKAQKYKDNLKIPEKDRPENIVSMWYKILQCNQLKISYEEQNNFTYDIVIRSRPDLIYFAPVIDEKVLQLYKKVLLVPEVESHGHASDIFAIGSSKIINIASNLYYDLDEIYNAGCVMNPHNIVEFYYNTMFAKRWYKYNFKLYFNRCRKKCNIFVCDYCHPQKKMLSCIPR